MNDPGFAIAAEERRRLLEANAAAGKFFRRELLRATGGWPARYLEDKGVEQVLSTESTWKVGYAPNTATALVDHLRSERFDYSTMVRAGLVEWNDHGDAVDRFRNQLMLAARSDLLSPVGFIGIGANGKVQSLSPANAIHRPSNVLAGVHEQMDLLRDGAIPVIVDDPADAIALSNISRQMDGQWAGIPVLGAGLSTAQARMLRKFTHGDTVIVILNGDDHQQKLTAGYVFDLALYYDRVRGVKLPSSLTTLALTAHAPERLQELLTSARPMMTHRIGASAMGDLRLDPDPPARGLDL